MIHDSIAVHGAAGRMGQRLVTLISQDKDVSVGAAIETPGHPQLGCDAGEIAGIGAIGVPIADASASEPMIGGGYSLVVVRLEDGADAAYWKTTIENNLQINKWISHSSEAKRVERIGNVIMAVLASKADCDKLAAAFLALG